MEIFADASYGDGTDSKSTSGVVHAYNGSVFDWKCKKQSTIALSTTEAELTALSYAIADLDWVIQLFRDAKLNLQIPIAVYQDNAMRRGLDSMACSCLLYTSDAADD